jgi:ubiquinone/menaquinone biosynthesis C-methylase UbiE
MKVNDINYWNKYYHNNKKLTPKSNFALFIKKKFIKKNFNILELGTGNGRDAFYLSKFFKSIIAVDQSSSAIKENKLKSKRLEINNLTFKKLNVNNLLNLKNKKRINLIYARFFIHSIDLRKEDLLIKNLSKFTNKDIYIALEFRTIKDKLMNKGKKISKYERITDHYRRFINPDNLIKKFLKNGYKVFYKKNGTNLSKTKTENPHLSRIIFFK